MLHRKLNWKFENTHNEIPFQKLTIDKNKIAIIKDSQTFMGDKTFNQFNKKLYCGWHDLQNKLIHNKNVIINGFGDIHPFENPPIFINAENVFFHHNYKYFTYYWLNRKIFPRASNFYLNGDPCDGPIFKRNLNIYVIEDEYFTAKRYAGEASYKEGIFIKNNPLIHEIKNDDYENLINSFEEEEPLLSEYVGIDSKIKEDKISLNDIFRWHGNIPMAIMVNAKW